MPTDDYGMWRTIGLDVFGMAITQASPQLQMNVQKMQVDAQINAATAAEAYQNMALGSYSHGIHADIPKPSEVAKTAASRVQAAPDPDEAKEYAADKLLHSVYERRKEMSETHSMSALVHKWIDYEDGK